MASQILVEDDVARRLGLFTLILVGALTPSLFKLLLDGRSVAGRKTMIVFTTPLAESAGIAARFVDEQRLAEVEFAHDSVN